MTLPLQDRDVKWGLYLLLFTAAETLYDGTCLLDHRTRRDPKVMQADRVLFEFSKSLRGGLLDDSAMLQSRLAQVALLFDQLETIDISVISLMVRRDYATEGERKRSSRKPAEKLRPRLRLVTDDEQ